MGKKGGEKQPSAWDPPGRSPPQEDVGDSGLPPAGQSVTYGMEASKGINCSEKKGQAGLGAARIGRENGIRGQPGLAANRGDRFKVATLKGAPAPDWGYVAGKMEDASRGLQVKEVQASAQRPRERM